MYGPRKAVKLSPREYFRIRRKYRRKIEQYVGIKKDGIVFLYKKMIDLFSQLCTPLARIHFVKSKILQLKEKYQDCTPLSDNPTTLKTLKKEHESQLSRFQDHIYNIKSKLDSILGIGLAIIYLNKNQKVDLRIILEDWIKERLQLTATKNILLKELKKLIQNFCSGLELSTIV